MRQFGLLRLSAAALAVLAAAAAAGCGSASSTGGPSDARASFANSFLSFGYPTAWKPFVFKITGTLHFDPMLYVSSQSAHQPCDTTTSTTVCGWPVDHLQPGGTLIVWENRGAPSWSLRTVAGALLRVGGRPAKKIVSRPGQCGSIGADETIHVDIKRPLPDNWTAFTACLRGPNLGSGEREVSALLASTHFKQP